MAKFTDRHQRPVALVPDFSSIPHYLTDLHQWVMWGYRWDDTKGCWNKPPLQASGALASSTDPKTWMKFQEALGAYESNRGRFDGVGLVVVPDNKLIGIDLDNMVTKIPGGRYELNKWAARVLELLPGYAEISPSETGVRIFVAGNLAQALKMGQTEIYNSGRYLTITGCILESPDNLPDCTDQVEYISNKLRALKTTSTGPRSIQTAQQDSGLTIQGLLKRAFASKNGAKIENLFQGDMSGYLNSDGEPDRSSADLGLCGLLSFWCKGDPGILDQMFRLSRLFRPKWDERHSGSGETYGQMTIQKALSNVTEFYGRTEREIERPGRASGIPPEAIKTSTRIHDLSTLADAANKLRHAPLSQGIRLAIGDIAHYYRPTRGRLSIVTGTPASGKTTLVSEMVRHAVNDHDWKIAIASFETRPLAKLLLNLNRSEVGKMAYPTSFTPGMTDQEHFDSSQKWAGKIFVFDVAEEDLTIDGILAYCEQCVVDHQIDGFVLDPWSDLHIPQNLRESYTHFCREGLNKLRRFTQTRNIHTWLIAHPTKMITKDHKIARPTLYSIADSAEFYNKADYGIVVHREDHTSSEVSVFFDKIKFDETGEPGVCYLNWDKHVGRYTGISSPGGQAGKRAPGYMYASDDDRRDDEVF